MEGGFFDLAELTAVRKPVAALPECGKCGLLKGCLSPKMPPFGDGRLGILVVGEAPGATEDRDGRPFVGEAGQLLRSTLRAAGASLDVDCRTMNSLSCRPPANKVDDERKVDYCRPLVMREIDSFDPVVILLLGGRAIRSVIGRLWRGDLGDVDRWVGWTIPVRRWNCWVVPTYHPSHILRNRDRRGGSEDPVKEAMFAAHVETAVNLSAARPWPDPVPDFAARVEVVMDPAEAAARLAAIPAGTTVAFDYETTTLKPQGPHAEIVSCGVSDGKTAFAYPWVGPAINETRFLLTDPSVKKVGWNVKMEDGWTRARLGTPVAGWVHDGMLGAHCLYNRAGGGEDVARRGRGVTGLKFQAFVQLGQEDYSADLAPYMKGEGDEGNNAPNRIRQAPLPALLRYNAYDALFTHVLCRRQMKELGL